MVESYSFIAGGIIIAIGMALLIPRVRACRSVVEGTEHLPDALHPNEYADSWKQFTLWRKLNKFATSRDVSVDVRQAATKAIRLEIATYVLFVIGGLLWAYGVATT
jgi:hypothetical protein